MSKTNQVQLAESFKNPNWLKRNIIELATIIGGLIAINLIFFASAYRESNTVNPENAGQLGDFVGGYIGTFFSLVSVVFLYRTLKNQRETATIEKFETKYFELLKLHRENVSEIEIGIDSGRKIFVAMIREFRAILKITKEVAKYNNQHLAEIDFFIISYCALFFGVGPNSSRLLIGSLAQYDTYFVQALERTLSNGEIKKKTKREKKFKYVPFEGHQSRLGHYYRHLFQTVSYVDKQIIGIEKYGYIKTIRAQLSTHEQALLFINSLTPMGRAWWESDLITRYRLVKNIPLEFFDKCLEIDLEGFFPKDYFEHQNAHLDSE